MSKHGKSISYIGAVLAVILFFCGLFHQQVVAFWNSDDGSIAMENVAYLMAFALLATILAVVCWAIMTLVTNIRILLAKQ